MNTALNNDSVDYNKISSVYDTGRKANAETIEKLVRLLQISKDSVILDMGCGTGNYTWAIQQSAKKVIGIDLSEGMLAKASAKYTDLQFIQGDVTRLPFSSGFFDGAFAIQVLHHVKEKLLFLKEAYRTLRKGACLAIHACSHQQMRVFWFYHYFPKGLQIDLARMPDIKEISNLFITAGFSDIGTEICYHDVVVADESPECYLNKDYCNSVSTFAFLTNDEIESGCEKIKNDIASGAVKDIVRQSEATVANETGGSCIIYGMKRSN
jgi:ubiquinone/menaquinone biosynthesis C-methylase UbiE